MVSTNGYSLVLRIEVFIQSASQDLLFFREDRGADPDFTLAYPRIPAPAGSGKCKYPPRPVSQNAVSQWHSLSAYRLRTFGWPLGLLAETTEPIYSTRGLLRRSIGGGVDWGFISGETAAVRHQGP